MSLRPSTETVKPSERMLLDYETDGKLRAWITYRRKDGRDSHRGTIATNHAYVKRHDDWVWLEIKLPEDKP